MTNGLVCHKADAVVAILRVVTLMEPSAQLAECIQTRGIASRRRHSVARLSLEYKMSHPLRRSRMVTGQTKAMDGTCVRTGRTMR
jgi:hypothetical protein